MRLLNVHTRQLEEFTGNAQDFPKYAILSHTWGKKEITFQDLSQPDHQQRPEYAKIEGCCRRAIRDKYNYVWVDTCCIDKSSSTELSEAINSMFTWYQDAAVCYVYLVDVPTGQNPFAKDSAFRKSRWFTRGWTLQELIAPSLLIFFDTKWNRMFHEEEDIPKYSLLQATTGISIKYIINRGAIRRAPVALLFSWASQRSTSRQEDEAYCLLGLVGVNMPLLYGEGGKAFLRLQEEIVKRSGDTSILAHGLNGYHKERTPRPHMWGAATVFAPHPSHFHNFGHDGRHIFYTASIDMWKASPNHFEMTNNGLRIEMSLYTIDKQNGVVFGILGWRRDRNGFEFYILLPLRQTNEENIFERVAGCLPMCTTSRPKRWKTPEWRSIYIQNAYGSDRSKFSHIMHSGQLSRVSRRLSDLFTLGKSMFTRFPQEDVGVILNIKQLTNEGGCFCPGTLYPPTICSPGYNEVRCIARGQGRRFRFIFIFIGLRGKTDHSIALRVDFSMKHGQVEDYEAFLATADAKYTAMEYAMDFPRFVIRDPPPPLDWQSSILISTHRGDIAQLNYISTRWEKTEYTRSRKDLVVSVETYSSVLRRTDLTGFV